MPLETVINFNGSHYLGEAADDIETLFRVLAAETLDPKFEDYGDFCEDGGRAFDDPEHNARWKGYRLFHGNFLTISHAFSVFTNDPEIGDRLVAAIRANKATAAYRAARHEMRRK